MANRELERVKAEFMSAMEAYDLPNTEEFTDQGVGVQIRKDNTYAKEAECLNRLAREGFVERVKANKQKHVAPWRFCTSDGTRFWDLERALAYANDPSHDMTWHVPSTLESFRAPQCVFVKGGQTPLYNAAITRRLGCREQLKPWPKARDFEPTRETPYDQPKFQ